MAVDTDATSASDAAQALAERLSRTIGADRDLRGYVRRAILEASPAGETILRRLVNLTIDNLRRHADPAKLPSGRDLTWLATQIVTINLAGTLLEPLLEPLLGHDPFTPAEVRRRTSTNLELLSAALTHLT